MAQIINGKKIAQEITDKLEQKISKKKIKPRLAVIIIGDDSASKLYVKIKQKVARKVDIVSDVYYLKEKTSQKQVIDLIRKLNYDDSVNGILVQLPLPSHIDQAHIVANIDPKKDVDGLHPLNRGFLYSNQNENIRLDSCTALGVIYLIEKYLSIKGKRAVVVGHSNLVGKPIAHLLLQKKATVCICHDNTKDLKKETIQADILVVAVGKPDFIKKDMIKSGALVVDVGINKVSNKLRGDVDLELAIQKADYITPVPGGVGPMTVAMLMQNTLKAQNIQLKDHK